MTKTDNSTEIRLIRSALKQARDHLDAGEPANMAPLRDMIDVLGGNLGQQADTMDRDTREQMADELELLVNDLEALEQIVMQRLGKEKD